MISLYFEGRFPLKPPSQNQQIHEQNAGNLQPHQKHTLNYCLGTYYLRLLKIHHHQYRWLLSMGPVFSAFALGSGCICSDRARDTMRRRASPLDGRVAR